MNYKPLPSTQDEILQYVDTHSIQKIKVAITDIDGVLRGKYIHVNKLKSALQQGFGFCSVIFGWDVQDQCYSRGQFSGWHNGYPDTNTLLDPSSFRLIPWENNQPFILGGLVTGDAQPSPVCPRQLLKKIQTKAAQLGFQADVGMEYEWFNFKESAETMHQKHFQSPQPITPGMFGYSLLRSGQNREFMNALMDELLAFNIPIEGLHTETGPGVYEAAILYSEMLLAADRAALFKTSVKEIAHRFNIMPSFMARWNHSLPGCSGHIHQSLRDLNTGAHLFYNDATPTKMSKTFEHYLAGQLHCMPELLPFYAPTVNSYKRLVEGYWAPTRANWGIDNRTVACRVIPGSPQSTRLETRLPGADVNPYLAIAASVASGLYGIEHQLELKTSAIQGNGYQDTQGEKLPNSLIEAATRMKHSSIAHTIFGKDFIEHFAYTREWEWAESQKIITDWELKRYFEII